MIRPVAGDGTSEAPWPDKPAGYLSERVLQSFLVPDELRHAKSRIERTNAIQDSARGNFEQKHARAIGMMY